MPPVPLSASVEQQMGEGGTFVPPQFSVPMRAPVGGFPDEKEIVISDVSRMSREKKNNPEKVSVYYGKEMLLNASPTLELSADDAESLLARLRQHPRYAEMREKLRGINESYLDDTFCDEDAKEDDTRRRVDYKAAMAIIKSNSSKRLSMCTSCLTRGQHRHYHSWVRRYMEDGCIPKAMEDYPDLSTVIDLVKREQTAYLHKLKEEMISCEACKCEAGYNKRCREGERIQEPHRACWNHNYIDEHVEQYVKRWLCYRLESQLLNGLLVTLPSDFSDERMNFSEVVCDLRKSIAAPPGGTPTATIFERTRQLCSLRVSETVQVREARGLKPVLPSAAFPPTLPLGPQKLGERAPALHFANSRQLEVTEGGTSCQKPQPEVAEALPPALPCKDVVGTFFSLCICKSALFKLATAHLSSFRSEFCLPVSCVWSSSRKCLDIRVEKPLPLGCESRRNISAMAMKRLVDSEVRLPTRSRCSTTGAGESKCYSEVSFGGRLRFLSVTNCVFDIREAKPVFRMVKMEYNCKGYNTVPDDEQTLLYEAFSKKEVICMWVLLHCNPNAFLYVYRINAYSSAVVGIEQFSAVSFANQVLPEYFNDSEVQVAWNCLHDVLFNMVEAVTRQYHHNHSQEQQHEGEGSGTPPKRTFLLRKTTSHFEVSLCSVNSCYKAKPSLEEAVESYIEPAGQSVCRREYLPPCVWPFPGRIPFTYGPAPRSCYSVNRTTAERHESKYYADTDIWEHDMQYYTVGEDGILWQRFVDGTQ